METCFIYGLYDVNDESKEIRYVGKTINISNSIRQHRNSSKFKRTHKECWISKLLCEDSNISYTILEECNNSIWSEREKYFISLYDNLTNSNMGGFGGNYKYELSYNEVRDYIISEYPLIKSQSQWYNFILENVLPKYIPRCPYDVYVGRGWVSWMHFLNSDNINSIGCSKSYLSYNDSVEWVADNLGISNVATWKHFVSLGVIPDFIPNKPDIFYGNKDRGWLGWNSFLGTPSRHDYLSYDECVIFISENYKNVTSSSIFRKCITSWELPFFIPSKPERIYSKEWLGWNVFLKKNKKLLDERKRFS